jgi:hypothetical protein
VFEYHNIHNTGEKNETRARDQKVQQAGRSAVAWSESRSASDEPYISMARHSLPGATGGREYTHSVGLTVPSGKTIASGLDVAEVNAAADPGDHIRPCASILYRATG